MPGGCAFFLQVTKRGGRDEKDTEIFRVGKRKAGFCFLSFLLSDFDAESAFIEVGLGEQEKTQARNIPSVLIAQDRCDKSSKCVQFIQVVPFVSLVLSLLPAPATRIDSQHN